MNVHTTGGELPPTLSRSSRMMSNSPMKIPKRRKDRSGRDRMAGLFVASGHVRSSANPSRKGMHAKKKKRRQHRDEKMAMDPGEHVRDEIARHEDDQSNSLA